MGKNNVKQEISELSKEQASMLLEYMHETDRPHLSESGLPFVNSSGLYFEKNEKGGYTGFDYSLDYEGVVEDFDTLEECMGWLHYEFEMDTKQFWLEHNQLIKNLEREIGMKAGSTDFEVGTKVKITFSDDPELIGAKGEITHPFPGLMAPGVNYVCGLENLEPSGLFAQNKINLTKEDVIEPVKFIQFVNTKYEKLFELEDGKNLEVHTGNGIVINSPCKYINPTHFEYGNDIWNVYYFAEFNEERGNKFFPAAELSPDELAKASGLIDEIITLAAEIDQFGKDFDPYGYGDAIENEEESFRQLVEDITNGNVEYLISWHKEIVDDGMVEAPRAQELIDKLRKFQPKAEERKPIDKLIQDAGSRIEESKSCKKKTQEMEL